MSALLCVLFFASGISALIFETLWFHQAGLTFGNSVWASSLVLSGFMGGLALGNALAARYADRLKNPVRAYAIAEAAIAFTGTGLVFLLPFLGAVLAPWLRPLLDYPWVLNPIRLLLVFLLLLIPSTAMGVTLPLLTKALILHDPRFGSVLGRLYGWNTLGAVVGVLVGESYLIGALGVRGTAMAAGTLNILAAAFSAWLSTRVPHAGAPAARAPVGLRLEGPWLAAAFLSGFCLLALEVVWFRLLLLFAFGSSAAFALMLAVVLVGIALAGLAASLWLRLRPDAYRFSSSIAFAAGLFCVVSYAAFPLVIAPFSTINLGRLDLLRVGLPLMFPLSFLSGIFFTLVGAGLRENLASETQVTGALTLANTTGAAIGSLAGAVLLLPLLGMERSFFLIAMLYGGIGLLLLFKSPAPRRIASAAAAVFLFSAILFPSGLMENRLFQIVAKRWHVQTFAITSKVVAVREGLTETIMYLQQQMMGKPVSTIMLTNSFTMSATNFVSRRYQKLYVYWPMAVHPNLKRALLICYGVGNTAKAMTDTKSLERIDVVDTSRDVLEMTTMVYPQKSDNPLNDPRVRVHIEDGRYFLRTTDQHFDLITGEPPPPGIAGVENLYSQEYFQLLYERLGEGGIVTYWLPIHSLTDASTKAILRAFCDVFGDCSLWNGVGPNLMMVGSRNAEGPVSEARFVGQWNDPVVAAEMRRLGFELPEQLGALFIGDAAYLKGLIAGVPPLDDDHPKRIEAPFESHEETQRLLQSLTDAAAARKRFENSPLVKQLWPERLLTASLPYFDLQSMINSELYRDLLWNAVRITRPDSSIRMQMAHFLLIRTSLSTPVLLLLDSSPDVQQIVGDVTPEELAQPVTQYQLGLHFLSERNYAAAVEPLSRAEQLKELHENAFILRIYALCMSGQADQAQHFAEERFAQMIREKGVSPASISEASLPPVWLWMKKTFGIDPVRSENSSRVVH